MNRFILERLPTAQTSDVDPDWLYPDPDPQNLVSPDPNPDLDPDPGRIQVNKIIKFSKHLLILKSQKNFYFQVTLNVLFLGSDLKNIISFEQKNLFLLVKLCFSLHFFSGFIPLDPDPKPDPDPHHWLKHKWTLREKKGKKCRQEK